MEKRGVEPRNLDKNFAQLAAKVSRQRSSSKITSLQLIDSTTIRLIKILFLWAKFRKGKSGLKLHLNLCYLDKDNQYPESFVITNAEEHDRNNFECLVDKTETTYVVDRGYFDYKVLGWLHNDRYFFVARMKSNTRITALRQIEVANPKTSEGTIISDQQVIIGGGVITSLSDSG